MGSPFAPSGPAARARAGTSRSESARTRARKLDRNTNEDFRVHLVTIEEGAIFAVEQALVNSAAADEQAATLRDVEKPAARAHVVHVLVAVVGDERMAVENADIRLDDRDHVEHVASFRRETVHHRFGKNPSLVVEADLEPVDQEVAETTAQDQVGIVDRRAGADE